MNWKRWPSLPPPPNPPPSSYLPPAPPAPPSGSGNVPVFLSPATPPYGFPSNKTKTVHRRITAHPFLKMTFLHFFPRFITFFPVLIRSIPFLLFFSDYDIIAPGSFELYNNFLFSDSVLSVLFGLAKRNWLQSSKTPEIDFLWAYANLQIFCFFHSWNFIPIFFFLCSFTSLY